MSGEECATALKECCSIELEIKKSEAQSTNPVPLNFPAFLEEELCRLSAHNPAGEYGGYVSEAKTAEFQADGVIAGRYLSGKCDLIMSRDADFNNDNCITINEFMGKTYSISSTSESTIMNALSYLPSESQKIVKVESAAKPLFEGESDIRMRALIGVIIGCDV